jgi:hypothetical protein
MDPRCLLASRLQLHCNLLRLLQPESFGSSPLIYASDISGCVRSSVRINTDISFIFSYKDKIDLGIVGVELYFLVYFLRSTLPCIIPRAALVHFQPCYNQYNIIWGTMLVSKLEEVIDIHAAVSFSLQRRICHPSS